MSRVIEKTLYQFDELSPAAKEVARDWFRGCIESDELTDYDDWQRVADILGVTFARKEVRLIGGATRSDPEIYWSGFASQGDGACYCGTYAYALKARAKIRAYAPQDEKLHAIADALVAVQKRNGYRLRATIGSGSGRYTHSGMMEFDVYREVGEQAPSEADERAVIKALRSFADWIYRQIEARNDYLTSEESVDESIRANEYEFDADGSRSRDA